MTIFVKNKHTLQIDEFKFMCCIGKNGSTIKKNEGDKKTPRGTFEIENLYFRKDRKDKPFTLLRCIEIKKDMGWCNDTQFPKKYNKLFKIEKKIKHEKLKRKDYKYDLLIPIKYNFKNPISGLGSCIFIHLTKDYKPTAGCVALKEKDFLIMLKLIKKNSKIKIF
jgi:L,D-peptidoglycan transpeptidase YkuD (ErfK/YbiS/YcfS/YnhG family)